MTQNTNQKLEELENQLEEEKLLLEIQKVRSEKQKYEIKQEKLNENLLQLQDDLKKKELKYRINKLSSWRPVKLGIIFLFFIVALLALAAFILFNSNFSLKLDLTKIPYYAIQIHLIWASVIVIIFKMVFVIFIGYLVYKLLHYFFEILYN